MRNVLGFLLIASVAFEFSSCGTKDDAFAARARQSGPVQADGFIVSPQNISEKIEVPGSLLPAEQTQIKSEVNGRIVQLNIQEGSVVQKGALLVKLFDGDLQTQLKKLEVQLQIAKKTQERQGELLKINGISQQEYDLVELNVQTLNVDIEATKIAIAKTEIRAPYAGQVGLRSVSLGTYIAPADVITTLRQVNELKLEFSIPEKYAKEIQKGDKVSFRVDGGSQAHQAVVMATENSVEQSTRTLRVKALVKNNHPELVPGIFARVNLQLGEDKHALLVPTQSVIPNARNKQVILLKKDSAVFTVVETGLRDSAFVQIVSGLKAGDTVITTGLMVIRPNAKVKVSQVASKQ
ncbi:MAG TPA: efflux RND transporter periplasmic adaptor subunit [Cyclobacteriaceae bacterium]|nr:efflux RND transporter periplasmic adaptor subunit [Cyclobacteriaceae bacterium]